MLRVKFHEEVLRRMYWDEEKSLGEIAKVLKTNSGSVHGAMCRYRISRRSRGASLRLSYQVGRRVSKRTAIEKEALQEMYWKEGKSITEIAKTLRKSTATVYEAMRYHQIPHRDKSSGLKLAYKRGKLVDKRYYMIRPNLTFNENLSYVLGVLKGDGWVSRYDKKRSIRYSVSLMANRREFVKSFHDALAACGLHPRLGYRTSKRKWETTAYSKIFYEWYKKISLEDIEKEALKNRELAAAFIRGFYESEGTRNIQYYERKNWYRFQFAMSNTNRELLILVQKLLAKLGFQSHLSLIRKGNMRWTDLYGLFIWRNGSIINFMNIVKPCIKNLMDWKGRQRVIYERWRNRIPREEFKTQLTLEEKS